MPPDAARCRAQLAFAELLDAALGFGGTVTAEHGVGLLERARLREFEGSLNPQRAIESALDPDNLFNPGKVF